MTYRFAALKHMFQALVVLLKFQVISYAISYPQKATSLARSKLKNQTPLLNLNAEIYALHAFYMRPISLTSLVSKVFT